MIKTLQKRFVMAAMAAITLLLVILLGAINGMNYWTTEKEITRTLIMLSEEPQQSVEQQNEPPLQPEENQKPWDIPKEDNMTMSQYFVIRLSEDNKIENIDVPEFYEVVEAVEKL